MIFNLKPQHEVLTELNVMVPMRDGVKLACDIYRPAQNGTTINGVFPVLLSSTPYSKSRVDLALDAEFFASHGYVSVIQDCRGRYKSEGGFTKYVGEGEDRNPALEIQGMKFEIFRELAVTWYRSPGELVAFTRLERYSEGEDPRASLRVRIREIKDAIGKAMNTRFGPSELIINIRDPVSYTHLTLPTTPYV